MLSTLLLVGTPQLTSEELMKRINARARAGFSVDFTLNHNSLGLIKGHFELKQPYNVSYRVQGDGDDFHFMIGPKGAIEIEHNSRQFSEIGPIYRVMFTNSTLSDLSFRCVPYALLGDMSQIFGPKMAVQQEKLNGKAIYKMSLNTKDNIADVWVTDSGVVQRYTHEFTDVSGHIVLDFKFSNHGPFHEKSVNLEPPTGYRMSVLKRETNPMQPGSKFPTDGWSAKVLNGQPSLVVFTSKECAATIKMATFLMDLAKTTRVVVLSDNGSPKGLASLPLIRSKQGSVFDRVNAPGSPTLFAVDAKGMVRQLWFGFDPKETSALKATILESLKK
ncbi:MAG: hypothetical protein ABL962_14290 [Fimbriimonadaceae bacterium]